jgi:hypothetical protein
MGHFRGLGFEPLPGQDLAEFLQQVASPHEQASLLQGSSSGSNGSDGCGSSGVKSAAELSAAFWASQQGQQIKVGLGRPCCTGDCDTKHDQALALASIHS